MHACNLYSYCLWQAALCLLNQQALCFSVHNALNSGWNGKKSCCSDHQSSIIAIQVLDPWWLNASFALLASIYDDLKRSRYSVSLELYYRFVRVSDCCIRVSWSTSSVRVMLVSLHYSENHVPYYSLHNHPTDLMELLRKWAQHQS